MRKIQKIIFIIILLMPFQLNAKVNIFSCEPEWQSLAKEIGGKNVKAISATSARQDPHHIRARPSLMSKIIKADLVVCSGGGLEEGWLPILLQRAKSDVQNGQIGNLMAIDYVDLIEIPANADRSMGHIHPDGNSHVHLNPYNILKMSQELTRRLTIIDSKNSTTYNDNLASFSEKWQKAILNWEQKAKNIQTKSVIVHHGSMNYLFDWLNINIIASMEPKPGIPPTISHLETLLQKVNKNPADLIVRTAYEPKDASKWLADKTKIKAIILPYTVGGDKQSDDLFSLFDRSLELLGSKI